MKILLFGSGGQLGKSILKLNLNKKHDIISLNKKKLDINHYKKTYNLIKKYKPDIVINCAAYTNVDNSETNKKIALQTNYEAVKNIALGCKLSKSILIHFSTDYVFDGKKNNYKETFKTEPLSFYGYSKLEGEKVIRKILNKYLIIRVSWLYSNHSTNFVTNIISKLNKNINMSIVNDQYGLPTSSDNLANVVVKIINSISKKNIKYGTYHYSNFAKKPISRFQFALEIRKINNLYLKSNSIIKFIKTSKYNNSIAIRPKNSSLNIDKICNTFNVQKRNWKIQLKKTISKIYIDSI